jgi:GGDEF domain-containing protein
MLSPQQVHVITSTPEMISREQPGKLFQAWASGEKVHSALAVPVGGEFGIASAVFYIEASEAHAFSLADQRVLRLISRMLEELLLASRARNQGMIRRAAVQDNPAIVDSTFGDFAVETDFSAEIDKLLARLQKEGMPGVRGGEEVSILSVDIDDQSSLAMKYGNRIARNLSQQVGRRIRGRTNSAGNFQVFHISADKYYILLEGVDLAGARSLAKQLHEVLSVKDYRILPLSAGSGRAVLPENMLEISNVTAHIGVSSYPLEKLDELLKRYAPDTAIMYVRTLILAGIDALLERGKLAGGNCVVSWDPKGWGYEVLSES